MADHTNRIPARNSYLDKSKHNKLARLFAPESIAFVGGSVAAMAIRRSLDIGFSGDIWPVHPHLEEIEGYRCYKSLTDLPDTPDAAFVAVRRELTIEAIRALSESGAGGAVCYAAGFAEMGEEGGELQRQLVEAAGNMPLVGPNCFGFVNYADRCTLWPYLFGGQPVEHGAALISQSGNIAMNLTMNQRSVRLTHVIGAGNQAVLGPADYIEALLLDDRVNAIGMYIEGIDDLPRFAVAARRALDKGVPIVVMKVGKTEASAKQSSSHTSSLTGSDVLHDAYFDRLGVVRVDSLNRLLETLKVLQNAASVSGRKIVTLSCSGGEAATIADLAPELGLETPPFSTDQLTDLQSLFPNYVTVSNPFDYNTSIWGDPEALESCFTASMQGEHDAAFLIYDHPTVKAKEADEWLEALDAFAAAHKKTRTQAYVLSTISELLPEKVRERALQQGVVPLQGLEDGLYAYAAAATYFESRRKNANCSALLWSATGHPSSTKSSEVLDEWHAKRALAAVGVPIPDGQLATAESAVGAANSVGYPVVVKAVGEMFLHKSDIGAVEVNLRNANEVRAAVERISTNTRAAGLEANRFLVEEMIVGAVAEVIVGVKRDQQFGPALVVGSGGILVELLADSKSLLLPVDRADIDAAISKLSVDKLLRGFRGQAPGDREALIDAILAIARYTECHWDSLLELDVNPLLILPHGTVATDALIIRA